MNALLLAAGFGTRLLPLTQKIPKCLVPICDKPLLEYWLDMLCFDDEIDNVYINTHYLPNQVQSFVKTYKNPKKIILCHETKLLGTAGTLKNLVKKLSSDSLFFAHADNLSVFDMKSFKLAFAKRPRYCEITMMVFETDNPTSCGIVQFNGDGVITGFEEKPQKPKSNLANGAVYILSREAIKSIGNNTLGDDFSTEIIPEFLKKINIWQNTEYHRDVGNILSLTQARSDMKKLLKTIKSSK